MFKGFFPNRKIDTKRRQRSDDNAQNTRQSVDKEEPASTRALSAFVQDDEGRQRNRLSNAQRYDASRTNAATPAPATNRPRTVSLRSFKDFLHGIGSLDLHSKSPSRRSSLQGQTRDSPTTGGARNRSSWHPGQGGGSPRVDAETRPSLNEKRGSWYNGWKASDNGRPRRRLSKQSSRRESREISAEFGPYSQHEIPAIPARYSSAGLPPGSGIKIHDQPNPDPAVRSSFQSDGPIIPSRVSSKRHSIPRKPVAHSPTLEKRRVSDTPSVPGRQSDVEDTHEALTRDPGLDDVQLAGIGVDLSNTTDTDHHETWAPAVTHETVHKHVEHIREEHIHREIHTHDVYHRILPITDIQVLPARHFIDGPNGESIEVSASEVPGRTGENADWVIAETVSQTPHDSMELVAPRKFTARDFPGDEGDHKEYVREDDRVPVKETTWVHPPELEQGGELSGQTEEFHFYHD